MGTKTGQGYYDDDFYDDDEDEYSEFYEGIEGVDFVKMPSRYDDDLMSFYDTNAIGIDSSMSNEEVEEVIGSQSLSSASTFDLLLELDKRFNHIVFAGKRILSEDDASKGSSIFKYKSLPLNGKGCGRITPRKTESDTKFITRGDIHTVMGMCSDMSDRVNYCMQEGHEYVQLGYGPSVEQIERNKSIEEDRRKNNNNNPNGQ